MFQQLILRFIIAALLCAFVQTPLVYGGTKENKNAARTARIKAVLAQLGTRPDAQAQLKLRDHRKLAGYMAGVEAETFTLSEAAAGAILKLRYDQICGRWRWDCS